MRTTSLKCQYIDDFESCLGGWIKFLLIKPWFIAIFVVNIDEINICISNWNKKTKDNS